MFKKCVIFIFLATAYTVLLAHDFTPHQHHTLHTAHHHVHHHNDDNQDGGDENNSFHLFQHIGETLIEYTCGEFSKYDEHKNGYQTYAIKSANIFLSIFEKPPLIVPLLRREHLTIQQRSPYFFLLKAPPASIA
ncbi:MAG: hypothetical protein EAZ35_03010 [Sphingobacteriia bacterium]|nr:MAG: hypothetical protein EAZ41_06220 [Sphingobacteriia bacterium]TAG31635.1 MAG: hypothetical protein EAZ35_03010 [Sphingobacteriia bacterium]